MVTLKPLEDTKAVKESDLVSTNETWDTDDLLLYVTASLNYRDIRQTFTIGDGSSSTDPISQRKFYNVPLQKQQAYYYFIRAYSEAHTTEVSYKIVVFIINY